MYVTQDIVLLKPQTNKNVTKILWTCLFFESKKKQFHECFFFNKNYYCTPDLRHRSLRRHD